MTAAPITVARDVAPRFPERGRGQGHVESWFLRATYPTERRAIWLKATVLVPLEGAPIAEAWCVVFAPGRSHGAKATVALDAATFRGETLDIDVGGCRFTLGPNGGTAKGRIDDLEWDLAFDAVPEMGGPMCLFPTRKMIDGGFPKSKLLTPWPVLRFRGTYTDRGERVAVSDWLGTPGHNWAKEHTYLYAWGQCVFPGADGQPHTMCEGFSGRLKMGPVVLPWLSSLVVRRGTAEYRFDKVFSKWRQRASFGDLEWRLSLSGPGGEAALWMKADPSEVACLGYRNPDGELTYCLNSKTSRAVLRVNPVNAEGFECRSEHGAAFEILSRKPDPRFPNPT